MLAIERRNEILEKLQMEKRVVVSELSQIYKVSEETIRRDLEKLAMLSVLFSFPPLSKKLSRFPVSQNPLHESFSD